MVHVYQVLDRLLFPGLVLDLGSIDREAPAAMALGFLFRVSVRAAYLERRGHGRLPPLPPPPPPFCLLQI